MTAPTVRLIVLGALFVGLFLASFYGPRAKAAEPGTVVAYRWQVWRKLPGGDWEPMNTQRGKAMWFFRERTACENDVAGQAEKEPTGTALTCLRIDARVVPK